MCACASDIFCFALIFVKLLLFILSFFLFV